MSGIYGPPIARGAVYGNRGNTYAILGDSIALGDTTTKANEGGATGGAIGSRDFLAQACFQSGGAMRYLFNAGVSGNTTTQMLARIQSDVIARTDPYGVAQPRPAKCILQGGINDFAAAAPWTTARDNFVAMAAQLVAAGIEPIFCGPPPYSTQSGRVFYANLRAWMQEYAARNGCHFLDLLSVDAGLVIPSTGAWVAGTNNASDGTHPSAVGARQIGAYIAAQLGPRTQAHRPYRGAHVDDFAAGAPSLIPGGLFLTNSAGLGTGYTKSGTLTASIVTGDAAINGNWQQLDWGSGSSPSVSSAALALSGKVSAGDRLLLTGRITTTVEAGGGTATVRAIYNDAGFTRFPFYGMVGWATDLANAVFAWEWPSPAGSPSLASVALQLMVNGGTAATLKVSELVLVNLTTLGF